MNIRFGFVAFLLALTVALPAQASLTICNKADALHSLAVAYKDGDNWKSAGWWNIDPGECKVVIGGDLTQRYYYYRATSPGRTFKGGTYNFCTQSEVFTILGEQGNCTARGYDSNAFRKLDTGKSAKDFTLNLVPADEAKEPETAPEPAPKPKVDQSLSGKYGEPYTDNVTLQECITDTEQPACTFHRGGTKFYVYDDGRTPEFVFTAMKALNPGTPITVSGDLVEVFDATAEVVLRDITVRPYDAADTALNDMQGYWYSTEDPKSQFNILGAEKEDQYDGQITGLQFLSVQDFCDDFNNGGLYLYAREPETQEGYCYAIESLDAFSMTLMYLPGGNFLEYRKLD